MLKPGSYFSGYGNRNPGVAGVLRFLEFDHLQDPALRDFSQFFADLACLMLDHLPDDPELTKSLDALREAKDRAVGLAAVLSKS